MQSYRLVFGGCVLVSLLVGSAGCQWGPWDRGGGKDGGILRAGIPQQAQLVQEGSGQLVFTPDEPGRIYLYSVNRDQVIGNFTARAGQRFAVDANAGRATLAGNEVAAGRLRSMDNYQIFFLPVERQDQQRQEQNRDR